MPDNLSNAPSTRCLSKVTLAAGSTTTISNTGTTTFMIKSHMYTKAAMSNVATPVLDATTGLAFRPIVANQGTVVVIGFDKDGNVKASQGEIQSLDVNGAFIRAPGFPGIPDTMAPVGYILLKGGATLVSTWTFGSSNLSSVTGMTYTFRDIGEMPERPQV